MKKLMIMLGAVAIAAVTQAAAVNWNTGNVYIASDKDGTTGSGNTYKANAAARAVNAYVYIITAEQYATASAMSTEDLYKTYVKGGATAEKAGKTSAMGSFTYTKNNLPDGSAETPQHLYSVFILEDTNTAANYDGVDAFVKATVLDSSWQDTVGFQNTNLATAQGSWTAVPEPTSGLLMLLGMAGLALRRRRA